MKREGRPPVNDRSTPRWPAQDFPAGRFRIKLAKEDFKFSCAHFTLFGPDDAELLHGHNYWVRVEVAGDQLDDLGILVDFERVKRAVRQLCTELDSRTLLPMRSPLLRFDDTEGGVTVRFGAKHYHFPEEDVVRLPLVNTTVELFAQMCWARLADEVDSTEIDHLVVEVGETAGQSCCFAAPLG